MKLYNQYFERTALIVLSSFILIFSSCKNNIIPEPDLGNAHILVVNSAASLPAINMFMTGNKLNTVPLVYGNTTGYRNVTSGIRDLQVKANTSNTLLATNTVRVIRDSSYTFFVFELNKTTATVIAEDDRSIPSFGNGKVKFANLSSGLSSADLVITNGPTIASSISFGTVGSYTELKAGTYNLALKLHGTNTILLTIPNVRVDNGKIYTIWSGGTLNGKGSTALAVQTIIQ